MTSNETCLSEKGHVPLMESKLWNKKVPEADWFYLSVGGLLRPCSEVETVIAPKALLLFKTSLPTMVSGNS